MVTGCPFEVMMRLKQGESNIRYLHAFAFPPQEAPRPGCRAQEVGIAVQTATKVFTAISMCPWFKTHQRVPSKPSASWDSWLGSLSPPNEVL